MSNKESQLQQEFEEKYEKLANDFERINKEFKNRINSFEKTNNHLKHELTEALASGGDAAIQLKKQHDQVRIIIISFLLCIKLFFPSQTPL